MEWEKNKRFKKLYPYVLSVEGGYVWDKHDPGGATNHGIAYNYNQGILKSMGITSPHQMRSLTQMQALQIYYRKYWLPSQADELPDERLALVYFDHVVNAGQGAADKLLVKLGGKFWYYQGDGPNVNFWWGMSMQYMLQRLWFYTRLSSFGRYGLGWFNRLVKIAKSVSKVGVALP